MFVLERRKTLLNPNGMAITLQMIAILDFGSQYTQLIAKKLRGLGFYSQIFPGPRTQASDLQKHSVTGIIFSGSPWSVGKGFDPNPSLLDMGVPVLGLCFGYQFLAKHFGGKVESQTSREYGPAKVEIVNPSQGHLLLKDFNSESPVWMSHGDSVVAIPPKADLILTSNNKPAGFCITDKKIWALQFHPEVHHTPEGGVLLKNFAQVICKNSPDWNAKSHLSRITHDIQQQTSPSDTIYCAVSGGVDSTVMAALLSKTRKVKAVFVDHGFLRSYDVQDLEQIFGQFPNIELLKVDASSVFWSELENVADPEIKRKTAGKLFVEVFESTIAQHSTDQRPLLAQGTIYSDVIESAGGEFSSPDQKIKSHHNVGGMPKTHGLKILEPLRDLFKDEVRLLGRELGINDEFLSRHPFPGPGLMIRCLGPLSRNKIEILKKADSILISELRARNLYSKTWQAFCVLLPVQTVGVMGDERSYEYVLAIRAVHSLDAMTAEASELPWQDLQQISTKIINQVSGINRVVYDLTSKPPATIEWE